MSVEVSKGPSVLNAHPGKMNILKRSESFSTINEILDNTIELLSDHCGPLAQYALVISTNGISQNNIFTKDGANIIRATEYISPIEEYVKSMIEYIGHRVDSVAKDGTTTSMLFTCYFLKYLITKFEDKFRCQSTYSIKKSFDNFSDKVLSKIDDSTITVDKLVEMGLTVPKARRAIAWIQSMTSSGGNRELSNIIATLFELDCTPGEIDVSIFKQDKLENSCDFRLEVDECDFKIKALIENSNDLNHNLHTELILDNVDIISSKIPMTTSSVEGTMLAAHLSSLVEVAVEDRIPLILLAPEFDSSIQLLVNGLRTKDVQIIMINNTPFSGHQELMLTVDCLYAIAGKDNNILNSDSSFNENNIIHNARIEYKNKELSFYNLFDRTNVVSGLHPFYSDTSLFRPYSELVASIDMAINHIKNSRGIDEAHVSMLFGYYQQLTTVVKAHVWLGGSNHDFMANIDVVKDSLGAANAAISKGIVVGSMIPLFKICDVGNVDNDKGIFTLAACYAVNNILQTIHDSTNGDRDNTISTHEKFYYDESLIDVIRQSINQYGAGYLHYDHFGDRTFGDIYEYIKLIDDEQLDGSYPVTQPASLYHELFRRISELVIKILSINKIIVPDSVYLKD